MRYDKIKKKPKQNNVLISKKIINKKDFFNNSEHDINHGSWRISFKDNTDRCINVHNITNEKHFIEQIQLLKEIRYFFEQEQEYFSSSTLASKCKHFKLFNEFLITQNIIIKEIKNINYEIIMLYCEYLKTQKGAYRKFLDLTSMLSSMKKYSKIKINNDIKNDKIPLVKFSRNSTNEIDYYSEEIFKNLTNTIKQIINDYFENKDIPTDIFVKASYWLISFCTGLNKTAIDSLTINSFDIVRDNLNQLQYIFYGAKNRSNKGHQISTVTIPENNDEHVFVKMISELLKINKEINQKYKINERSLFLFYSIKKKSPIKYDGENKTLKRTKLYNKYAALNNVENINLSTLKIRSQWSSEIFKISKNEQIVSEMLGHSNISITNNNYIKSKIKSEHQVKFSIFQELLTAFSKQKYFKTWVDFQNNFDLSDDNLISSLNDIKKGNYNTALGKCLDKRQKNNNICENYLNCFSCENFSIIGDKDLWKIMSFRESLMNLKQNDLRYNEIFKNIENTLKKVDKDSLIEARVKLLENKHPFWKNNITIKVLTDTYEKGLK